MCGIVGLVNLNGAPIPDDSITRQMSAMLEHRGPDDQGSLVDGAVGFGFRRLCIIDLKTGHQPISNYNETIWCMFNGEIYNFVELRVELQSQGYQFHTESDTEVILHAYEAYGLDFVQYLRGMFAIALWDGKQQRLVLARDRIGKKPLFYSVNNGQLAFASEMKAFLKWPGLDRSINPKALHDYLTFLYVPAPDTIFADVHKLPPAHMLVVDCREGSLSIQKYWSLNAHPDRSKPFSYYAEGLREIIQEAVRLRLRSDVPLGAFLSGGIDSSIVVGLMSRELESVKTFSIGFSDPRYDETRYARLAASSFNTVHREEVVDATNMTPEELIRLVWYMDEPFGDSSFIPTYWVSKIARKYVTVVLSGDGGDELFAGYSRYRYFQYLTHLGLAPRILRRAGGEIARRLRDLALPVSSVQAERLRQVQKAFELSVMGVDQQIFSLTTYLDEASKDGIYNDDWRASVNGYKSFERMLEPSTPAINGNEPLVRFMSQDFSTNMVDDGLVKVDRASMACSLEVRSPLLDHHVVEFAMRIPPEYKLSKGKHKLILKQVFEDLLPREIIKRGKQGFEVPFAQWFQTKSWRSLLLDMLSEERLRKQGIFDPSGVVRLRDCLLLDPEAENLPISAYQLRHRVWTLLVFQLWYDRFMH